MNLDQLDQRVDVWEGEAAALLSALQRYLHEVSVRSTRRPVPLAEAMSIRPVTTVCRQLARLLQHGSWSRLRKGRPVPRPRALRLRYDELLQLLALYQAGELRPLLPDQHEPLQCCLGKVHQRGQNLSTWFQV